jgi:DNA-binding transcriptional MerR regulator
MESGLRIPEKLFFRIGEVCDLIKVQPHVLRYWETEFPMLAPQKNRAGQRVYRRKDVEMVLRIRNLLYEEKFTIAGAKKRLLDEGHRSGPRVKVEPPVKVDPQVRIEPQDVRPPPDDITQEVIPQVTSEVDPEVKLVERVPELEPPLPSSPSLPGLTEQARRALGSIRHDLEDLLTMLNSNASINR